MAYTLGEVSVDFSAKTDNFFKSLKQVDKDYQAFLKTFKKTSEKLNFSVSDSHFKNDLQRLQKLANKFSIDIPVQYTEKGSLTNLVKKAKTKLESSEVIIPVTTTLSSENFPKKIKETPIEVDVTPKLDTKKMIPQTNDFSFLTNDFKDLTHLMSNLAFSVENLNVTLQEIKGVMFDIRYVVRDVGKLGYTATKNLTAFGGIFNSFFSSLRRGMAFAGPFGQLAELLLENSEKYLKRLTLLTIGLIGYWHGFGNLLSNISGLFSKLVNTTLTNAFSLGVMINHQGSSLFTSLKGIASLVFTIGKITAPGVVGLTVITFMVKSLIQLVKDLRNGANGISNIIDTVKISLHPLAETFSFIQTSISKITTGTILLAGVLTANVISPITSLITSFFTIKSISSFFTNQLRKISQYLRATLGYVEARFGLIFGNVIKLGYYLSKYRTQFQKLISQIFDMGKLLETSKRTVQALAGPLSQITGMTKDIAVGALKVAGKLPLVTQLRVLFAETRLFFIDVRLFLFKLTEINAASMTLTKNASNSLLNINNQTSALRANALKGLLDTSDFMEKKLMTKWERFFYFITAGLWSIKTELFLFFSLITDISKVTSYILPSIRYLWQLLGTLSPLLADASTAIWGIFKGVSAWFGGSGGAALVTSFFSDMNIWAALGITLLFSLARQLVWKYSLAFARGFYNYAVMVIGAKIMANIRTFVRNQIWKTFKMVMKLLASPFVGIYKVLSFSVKGLFFLLGGLLKISLVALTGVLEISLIALTTLFKTFFQMIYSIVADGIRLLLIPFKGLATLIAYPLTKLMGILAPFLKTALVNILSTTGNLLSRFFGWFSQKQDDINKSTVTFINTITSYVSSKISNFTSTVMGYLLLKFPNVFTIYFNITEKLGYLFNKMTSGIIFSLKKVKDAATWTMSSIFKLFSYLFPNITSFLKNNLFKTIGDGLSAITSSVVNTLSFLWGGISAFFGKLFSPITKAVSGIRGALGFQTPKEKEVQVKEASKKKYYQEEAAVISNIVKKTAENKKNMQDTLDIINKSNNGLLNNEKFLKIIVDNSKNYPEIMKTLASGLHTSFTHFHKELKTSTLDANTLTLLFSQLSASLKLIGIESKGFKGFTAGDKEEIVNLIANIDELKEKLLDMTGTFMPVDKKASKKIQSDLSTSIKTSGRNLKGSWGELPGSLESSFSSFGSSKQFPTILEEVLVFSTKAPTAVMSSVDAIKKLIGTVENLGSIELGKLYPNTEGLSTSLKKTIEKEKAPITGEVKQASADLDNIVALQAAKITKKPITIKNTLTSHMFSYLFGSKESRKILLENAKKDIEKAQKEAEKMGGTLVDPAKIQKQLKNQEMKKGVSSFFSTLFGIGKEPVKVDIPVEPYVDLKATGTEGTNVYKMFGDTSKSSMKKDMQTFDFGAKKPEVPPTTDQTKKAEDNAKKVQTTFEKIKETAEKPIGKTLSNFWKEVTTEVAKNTEISKQNTEKQNQASKIISQGLSVQLANEKAIQQEYLKKETAIIAEHKLQQEKNALILKLEQDKLKAISEIENEKKNIAQDATDWGIKQIIAFKNADIQNLELLKQEHLTATNLTKAQKQKQIDTFIQASNTEFNLLKQKIQEQKNIENAVKNTYDNEKKQIQEKQEALKKALQEEEAAYKIIESRKLKLTLEGINLSTAYTKEVLTEKTKLLFQEIENIKNNLALKTQGQKNYFKELSLIEKDSFKQAEIQRNIDLEKNKNFFNAKKQQLQESLKTDVSGNKYQIALKELNVLKKAEEEKRKEIQKTYQISIQTAQELFHRKQNENIGEILSLKNLLQTKKTELQLSAKEDLDTAKTTHLKKLQNLKENTAKEIETIKIVEKNKRDLLEKGLLYKQDNANFLQALKTKEDSIKASFNTEIEGHKNIQKMSETKVTTLLHEQQIYKQYSDILSQFNASISSQQNNFLNFAVELQKVILLTKQLGIENKEALTLNNTLLTEALKKEKELQASKASLTQETKQEWELQNKNIQTDIRIYQERKIKLEDTKKALEDLQALAKVSFSPEAKSFIKQDPSLKSQIKTSFKSPMPETIKSSQNILDIETQQVKTTQEKIKIKDEEIKQTQQEKDLRNQIYETIQKTLIASQPQKLTQAEFFKGKPELPIAQSIQLTEVLKNLPINQLQTFKDLFVSLSTSFSPAMLLESFKTFPKLFEDISTNITKGLEPAQAFTQALEKSKLETMNLSTEEKKAQQLYSELTSDRILKLREISYQSGKSFDDFFKQYKGNLSQIDSDYGIFLAKKLQKEKENSQTSISNFQENIQKRKESDFQTEKEIIENRKQSQEKDLQKYIANLRNKSIANTMTAAEIIALEKEMQTSIRTEYETSLKKLQETERQKNEIKKTVPVKLASWGVSPQDISVSRKKDELEASKKRLVDLKTNEDRIAKEIATTKKVSNQENLKNIETTLEKERTLKIKELETFKKAKQEELKITEEAFKKKADLQIQEIQSSFKKEEATNVNLQKEKNTYISQIKEKEDALRQFIKMEKTLLDLANKEKEVLSQKKKVATEKEEILQLDKKTKTQLKKAQTRETTAYVKYKPLLEKEATFPESKEVQKANNILQKHANTINTLKATQKTLSDSFKENNAQYKKAVEEEKSISQEKIKTASSLVKDFLKINTTGKEAQISLEETYLSKLKNLSLEELAIALKTSQEKQKQLKEISSGKLDTQSSSALSDSQKVAAAISSEILTRTSAEILQKKKETAEKELNILKDSLQKKEIELTASKEKSINLSKEEVEKKEQAVKISLEKQLQIVRTQNSITIAAKQKALEEEIVAFAEKLTKEQLLIENDKINKEKQLQEKLTNIQKEIKAEETKISTLTAKLNQEKDIQKQTQESIVQDTKIIADKNLEIKKETSQKEIEIAKETSQKLLEEVQKVPEKKLLITKQNLDQIKILSAEERQNQITDARTKKDSLAAELGLLEQQKSAVGRGAKEKNAARLLEKENLKLQIAEQQSIITAFENFQIASVKRVQQTKLQPTTTVPLPKITPIKEPSVDKMTSSFKKAMKTQEKELKEAVKNIPEVVIKALQSKTIINRFSTLGKTWAQTLQKSFAQELKNIQKVGPEIILQLIKGIEANSEKLKKPLIKLAKTIMRFFPQSPAEEGELQKLTSAGMKIPEQLSKGISQGSSRVKKPISKLAESIMRFFPRSDAKEGELSELTLSGEKIPDQIAKGIDKKKHLVKKSIVGLVSGVWKLYKQILSMGFKSLSFDFRFDDIINQAKSVQILSNAFDMSTNSLQAIDYAAKQYHSSLSDLNMVFRTLHGNIQQALLDPLSETSIKFQQLGIDVWQLGSSTDATVDSMIKLAEHIERGGHKGKEAGELMGVMQGSAYLQMFKEASKMKILMQEAASTGSILDKSFFNMTASFVQVKNKFETFINVFKSEVVLSILPVIIDYFTKITNGIIKHKKYITSVIFYAGKLVSWLFKEIQKLIAYIASNPITAVKKIGENLVRIWEALVPILLSIVMFVWTSIENIIYPGVKHLLRLIWGQISIYIDAGFIALGKTMGEVPNLFVDVLTGKGFDFLKIKEITKHFKNELEYGKSILKEQLEEMDIEAKKKIKNTKIPKEIKVQVNKALSDLSESFLSVKKEFSTSLPEFSQKTEEVLDTQKTKVKELTDEWKNLEKTIQSSSIVINNGKITHVQEKQFVNKKTDDRFFQIKKENEEKQNKIFELIDIVDTLKLSGENTYRNVLAAMENLSFAKEFQDAISNLNKEIIEIEDLDVLFDFVLDEQALQNLQKKLNTEIQGGVSAISSNIKTSSIKLLSLEAEVQAPELLNREFEDESLKDALSEDSEETEKLIKRVEDRLAEEKKEEEKGKFKLYALLSKSFVNLFQSQDVYKNLSTNLRDAFFKSQDGTSAITDLEKTLQTLTDKTLASQIQLLLEFVKKIQDSESLAPIEILDLMEQIQKGVEGKLSYSEMAKVADNFQKLQTEFSQLPSFSEETFQLLEKISEGIAKENSSLGISNEQFARILNVYKAYHANLKIFDKNWKTFFNIEDWDYKILPKEFFQFISPSRWEMGEEKAEELQRAIYKIKSPTSNFITGIEAVQKIIPQMQDSQNRKTLENLYLFFQNLSKTSVLQDPQQLRKLGLLLREGGSEDDWTPELRKIIATFVEEFEKVPQITKKDLFNISEIFSDPNISPFTQEIKTLQKIYEIITNNFQKLEKNKIDSYIEIVRNEKFNKYLKDNSLQKDIKDTSLHEEVYSHLDTLFSVYNAYQSKNTLFFGDLAAKHFSALIRKNQSQQYLYKNAHIQKSNLAFLNNINIETQKPRYTVFQDVLLKLQDNTNKKTLETLYLFFQNLSKTSILQDPYALQNFDEKLEKLSKENIQDELPSSLKVKLLQYAADFSKIPEISKENLNEFEKLFSLKEMEPYTRELTALKSIYTNITTQFRNVNINKLNLYKEIIENTEFNKYLKDTQLSDTVYEDMDTLFTVYRSYMFANIKKDHELFLQKEKIDQDIFTKKTKIMDAAKESFRKSSLKDFQLRKDKEKALSYLYGQLTFAAKQEDATVVKDLIKNYIDLNDEFSKLSTDQIQSFKNQMQGLSSKTPSLRSELEKLFYILNDYATNPTLNEKGERIELKPSSLISYGFSENFQNLIKMRFGTTNELRYSKVLEAFRSILVPQTEYLKIAKQETVFLMQKEIVKSWNKVLSFVEDIEKVHGEITAEKLENIFKNVPELPIPLQKITKAAFRQKPKENSFTEVLQKVIQSYFSENVQQTLEWADDVGGSIAFRDLPKNIAKTDPLLGKVFQDLFSSFSLKEELSWNDASVVDPFISQFIHGLAILPDSYTKKRLISKEWVQNTEIAKKQINTLFDQIFQAFPENNYPEIGITTLTEWIKKNKHKFVPGISADFGESAPKIIDMDPVFLMLQAFARNTGTLTKDQLIQIQKQFLNDKELFQETGNVIVILEDQLQQISSQKNKLLLLKDSIKVSTETTPFLENLQNVIENLSLQEMVGNQQLYDLKTFLPSKESLVTDIIKPLAARFTHKKITKEDDILLTSLNTSSEDYLDMISQEALSQQRKNALVLLSKGEELIKTLLSSKDSPENIMKQISQISFQTQKKVAPLLMQSQQDLKVFRGDSVFYTTLENEIKVLKEGHEKWIQTIQKDVLPFMKGGAKGLLKIFGEFVDTRGFEEAILSFPEIMDKYEKVKKEIEDEMKKEPFSRNIITLGEEALVTHNEELRKYADTLINKLHTISEGYLSQIQTISDEENPMQKLIREWSPKFEILEKYINGVTEAISKLTDQFQKLKESNLALPTKELNNLQTIQTRLLKWQKELKTQYNKEVVKTLKESISSISIDSSSIVQATTTYKEQILGLQKASKAFNAQLDLSDKKGENPSEEIQQWYSQDFLPKLQQAPTSYLKAFKESLESTANVPGGLFSEILKEDKGDFLKKNLNFEIPELKTATNEYIAQYNTLQETFKELTKVAPLLDKYKENFSFSPETQQIYENLYQDYLQILEKTDKASKQAAIDYQKKISDYFVTLHQGAIDSLWDIGQTFYEALKTNGKIALEDIVAVGENLFNSSFQTISAQMKTYFSKALGSVFELMGASGELGQLAVAGFVGIAGLLLSKLKKQVDVVHQGVEDTVENVERVRGVIAGVETISVLQISADIQKSQQPLLDELLPIRLAIFDIRDLLRTGQLAYVTT